METLKLELERLEKEEKVCNQVLLENVKKQNEIRVALFKDEKGWEIGDEIKLKSGKTGVIDRITVQYNWVRPVLRMRKKDGTVGNREIVMYDWDIKDAIKL